MAGAFMADGRTRGTSGPKASWRPPQPHDEFSRRSFDSALKECANVVYSPPAISCGARPSSPREQTRWEQCLELAAVGPQVVGDPRPTQNETTMGEMLGRSSR